MYFCTDKVVSMAEIDQDVMPDREGDASGVKIDSRPKVIEVQNTT